MTPTFAIAISVILIILAIVWRPSRVAIGAVLMLLGIVFSFTIIGLIIGLPTFFIGVIFLAWGLMGGKKRIVVELPGDKKRKEPDQIRSRLGDLDELEKLASLKDKGIITEEEFNTKKKQILGI